MSEDKEKLEQEGQLEESSTPEDEMNQDQQEEEVDPTTALRKELEESHNRYLRVQADFDNFRKRTRKEKEDSMKYASLPVVEALLPAVDNLERALTASYDATNLESLLKGVEMVYRQIQQVLEQEGLQVIEAVGKPFDPQIHQAVMQEESADQEAGAILQELQKGYMMKDRVIRPSMVKVSS
ncbi:MAG TPA: nucleotide exchange factor GrpE [Bacillota bacterium]|nr:nucleotide exchange factor GrpE [Bacillota bacterium]